MEARTKAPGQVMEPETIIAGLLQAESPICGERRAYQPPLCPCLQSAGATRPADGGELEVLKVAREQLPFVSQNKLLEVVPAPDKPLWDSPRNIGIVLSGGPAPGGHNVIAGLFEAAKRAHPENRVLGFLAGPKGIMTNKHVEVSQEMVAQYKNSGGFHMLGTGRDKIDNPQKMEQCRQTCATLKLSGLVVVGGDDSNTNSAFLAENMRDLDVQVIGIPKTIDGDLQVPGLCQIPF